MVTALPAVLRDVRVSVRRGRRGEPYEVACVEGVLAHEPDGGLLHYFASAPSERRASFSGSGMPHTDAQQAFGCTRNRGSVRVTAVTSDSDAAGARRFAVCLAQPGAYYTNFGMSYAPPAVHLWYTRGGRRYMGTVQTGGGIPFRSLTYPMLPTRPRSGVGFYEAAPTLVRSQERILLESGYPQEPGATWPPNFWGLCPPS